MDQAAELLAAYGSPLYVYDEVELRHRCRSLIQALPGVEILYAMKANANPAILQVIREEGLGVDAVSLGEVRQARQCGFAPEQISFTGNNVGRDELEMVHQEGVQPTLDSLSQLETWGRLFPGTPIGVRLNANVGEGHHEHVITSGPQSKFGIEPELREDLLAAAARHRLCIEVVQQHIGSGILETAPLLRAADVLLELAAVFPDLACVDFGGGLGIPYHEKDRPFALEEFARELVPRLEAFREKQGGGIRFRLEPGRFVVGTCGTLLVTVTAVKRTAHQTFVGTDSGFNHLLRPAFYGSYHRVENLSHPEARVERASVAGNICESGDLLARDRALPRCQEGDILAIRDVGAYGFSMASTYNLRPRPAEVMVSGKQARLIRKRETLADLLLDGLGRAETSA